MKKNQYFKVETNILKEECMERLTEKHGREGDTMRISSVYLNRVMKTLEDKRKRQSKVGKKNAPFIKRTDNRPLTVTISAEEKSREEATTLAHAGSSCCPTENSANENIDTGDCDHFPDLILHTKTWQEYFEEAVTDEEWIALLIMNSGVSPMFVRHQELIIQAFRDYVELQGTGVNIQSHRDIRSYFANFLRPGTTTHKRVIRQLLDHEEHMRNNPEHRFETVDQVTGARSYHGHPIPEEAPPRPNNTAVWSADKKKWI